MFVFVEALLPGDDVLTVAVGMASAPEFDDFCCSDEAHAPIESTQAASADKRVKFRMLGIISSFQSLINRRVCLRSLSSWFSRELRSARSFI
jgi:hypothetical protein